MTVDRRGFIKLFGAAAATLAFSRSTGLTETYKVGPPEGFIETEPGHHLTAIDGLGVQHDLAESVVTFDMQRRFSEPVYGPDALGDGCLYGRRGPSFEGLDIKVLSIEPLPSHVAAFYSVEDFLFGREGSFGSLYPVQHATRATKKFDWYGGMEIQLGDYDDVNPIQRTFGAMRGEPVDMHANWFRTTGPTKLPDHCYPDTMPREASEKAEASMWSQWIIGS